MRNKSEESSIPHHPKDVAEMTLNNLSEFSKILEGLSRRTAAAIAGPDFHLSFNRLMDGVNTLSEGVSHIKKLQRIGYLQPVNLLEADLASILSDLYTCYESQPTEYLLELLHEHLPLNMRQWREEGIPALIRARDS
jgi:hypothetical protein